ncbi:MAG: hypothetical protein PHE93_00845 [Clostridia bacterium]|nr:hypothetical protein [Clostridia bacterium]
MKKLLTFSILIAITLTLSFGVLSFATNDVALADANTYIEIPDETELSSLTSASVSAIPFCDGASFDPIFYLPTTYYLKVTGEKKLSVRLGDSYPVSYNGLNGYVFVSDFETAPAITENATIDTVGEAPALALTYVGSTASSISNSSVDSSWAINYMGEVCDSNGVIDTTKVFVKCAKADETVYGEILKSNVAAFTIPLHQVTLNAQAALNEGDVADGVVPSISPFGNDSIVKTILIIGIIVPAVLIIILLFKPRKRPDTYDNRSRRMTESSRYDNSYRSGNRYDDPRYANDYGRNDNRRDRDDGYRPRDYRDEDR